MNKTLLAATLITLTILAITATAYILQQGTTQNNTTQSQYTYEIINTYPHDPTAFTEGLVIQDGTLYEGTGLYGESRLQKTQLETGNITQTIALPNQYFGEGITIINNKITQLTWLEHIGFVYEKTSFQTLKNFTYPGEGWGITNDGQRLIMSNGTAMLTFLDPQTLQPTGTIQVHDSTGPVPLLNELEYIKGDVYANIFGEKRIAIININTGQVKAWVNLNGLQDPNESNPDNVLNGIAYDPNGDRLFVTGKRWTHLFEIKLIPS